MDNKILGMYYNTQFLGDLNKCDFVGNEWNGSGFHYCDFKIVNLIENIFNGCKFVGCDGLIFLEDNTFTNCKGKLTHCVLQELKFGSFSI